MRFAEVSLLFGPEKGCYFERVGEGFRPLDPARADRALSFAHRVWQANDPTGRRRTLTAESR